MLNNKIKKITYIAMSTGALLAPSLCAAEWNWLTFEGEEKPWSVNVGTRVWFNEWDTNTRNSNLTAFAVGGTSYTIQSTSTNHNEQVTSEAHEATPIPYLSVRYGRFFIGGNYYAQTSFSFSPLQQTSFYDDGFLCDPNGCFGGSGSLNVSRNMTGERLEWDTSAGYYVLPGLAFTVGYKSISMDFTQAVDFSIERTGTGDDIHASGQTTFSSTNRFTGPTIGIVASVPIAYGFGLYGSYAHGFMSFDYKEQQDGVNTFKASDGGDYDIGEVGVSYSPNLKEYEYTAHLPLQSAAVFAGYRYQRLQYGVNLKDVNTGADNGFPVQNASDTTQGFVAGVNFGF